MSDVLSGQGSCDSGLQLLLLPVEGLKHLSSLTRQLSGDQGKRGRASNEGDRGESEGRGPGQARK